MSTSAPVPSWPTDVGHRDAIGTLLEMASAEQRWGEHDRALMLLEAAEQIVGKLPPGYERIRRRCQRDFDATAAEGQLGVQFPHAVVATTRRSGGRPT